MPQGVLIIGKVKELISVAEGKPTSPQQFTVRDEVCSLGVNGGGPEARGAMPNSEVVIVVETGSESWWVSYHDAR